MSTYHPTGTSQLSESPTHSKLHRVYSINTGPASPDDSIEIGHYGVASLKYGVIMGTTNTKGEAYMDFNTYLAQLYHMDMSGFACDFDVPNQFMYPYVNTDLF